jgi:hypothetical protein
MIVQKCCHDFDILTWNIPSPVTRLVSFGSLLEFRAERAPPCRRRTVPRLPGG